MSLPHIYLVSEALLWFLDHGVYAGLPGDKLASARALFTTNVAKLLNGNFRISQQTHSRPWGKKVIIHTSKCPHAS